MTQCKVKKIKWLKICLTKVISGGQQGVEIAGLKAAKSMGIRTGGSMPVGFVTEGGNKPGYSHLYKLKDDCENYRQKTWANVKNANATIRIATDFTSRGEVCTLNAIRHYAKPHLDVYFAPREDYFVKPDEVAIWLIKNNVSILNVAGNTGPELETAVQMYLMDIIDILQEGRNYIGREDDEN